MLKKHLRRQFHIIVVSAAAIDIIENRYYIVFAQNTKWRRYRIILTIFNYSCSLAWTLPAFILLPDQNTAAPGALRVSVFFRI